MLETMVVHVAPLLVEYLIFTLFSPAEVHVMLCTVEAFQISPPLGAVTVIPVGAAMVNAASLTSYVERFDASLMRTRACVVGVLGTGQP